MAKTLLITLPAVNSIECACVWNILAIKILLFKTNVATDHLHCGLSDLHHWQHEVKTHYQDLPHWRPPAQTNSHNLVLSLTSLSVSLISCIHQPPHWIQRRQNLIFTPVVRTYNTTHFNSAYYWWKDMINSLINLHVHLFSLVVS